MTVVTSCGNAYHYRITHYLQDCHSEAQPKNLGSHFAKKRRNGVPLRCNDLTKSNRRDSSLCSE
jgi:hypothetical protein